MATLSSKLNLNLTPTLPPPPAAEQAPPTTPAAGPADGAKAKAKLWAAVEEGAEDGGGAADGAKAKAKLWAAVEEGEEEEHSSLAQLVASARGVSQREQRL